MDFPVELRDKFARIAAESGFRPEDVGETFTRGGGHGGQNVNKSTNCVELTHRPTGITVRIHHHRGMHQNRMEAWELLILKVQELKTGIASELGQKKRKIEKQKQRRSRRSKQKMLAEKHHHAEIKEMRKDIPVGSEDILNEK